MNLSTVSLSMKIIMRRKRAPKTKRMMTTLRQKMAMRLKAMMSLVAQTEKVGEEGNQINQTNSSEESSDPFLLQLDNDILHNVAALATRSAEKPMQGSLQR